MIMETIEQAQSLWGEGQEDEAIKLLLPLVKEGNVLAKSILGVIFCYYFRGDKFPRIKEGEGLLREACKAGNASACHNLGTLWLGNAPGIGHNPKKAAFYYLKSKDLAGPVADNKFYEHWGKVLNR